MKVKWIHRVLLHLLSSQKNSPCTHGRELALQWIAMGKLFSILLTRSELSGDTFSSTHDWDSLQGVWLIDLCVPPYPHFKSSPGDTNTQPRLRTTALENTGFIFSVQINIWNAGLVYQHKVGKMPGTFLKDLRGSFGFLSAAQAELITSPCITHSCLFYFSSHGIIMIFGCLSPHLVSFPGRDHVWFAWERLSLECNSFT